VVRFRFLDCGFVIVGSWCPVKLLRVFLLWLVLLALPSQGMGAGILADCERAHTTTKKLRKMQPQRPPTAARAGHEHCHDHHGKATPVRFDDRCKSCPSCGEVPQHAMLAGLTMSAYQPRLKTHRSSRAHFLSFVPDLLLRPPRLVV
jgi:hypothetical protein